MRWRYCWSTKIVGTINPNEFEIFISRLIQFMFLESFDVYEKFYDKVNCLSVYLWVNICETVPGFSTKHFIVQFLKINPLVFNCFGFSNSVYDNWAIIYFIEFFRPYNNENIFSLIFWRWCYGRSKRQKYDCWNNTDVLTFPNIQDNP